MTMMRWDPYGETASLRRAMETLFEDAYVPAQQQATGRQAGGTGMALDLMERADAFLVRAVLPGVKPEDVSINLERNILTIEGESHDEHAGGGQGVRYHHREHRHGRFMRRVMLPVEVDPASTQASYEHGVLTVTLPKASSTRARRIPVRAHGAGHQTVEGQATRTDGGAASLSAAADANTKPGAGALSHAEETQTGAGIKGGDMSSQPADQKPGAGALSHEANAGQGGGASSGGGQQGGPSSVGAMSHGGATGAEMAGEPDVEMNAGEDAGAVSTQGTPDGSAMAATSDSNATEGDAGPA